MKLLYFANVRLPTEKAHGIQIMKTCEALASGDTDVRLIVPRRVNSIRKDPFQYYDVNRNFEIVRLPTIDLLFLPFFKKLWFLIESVTFAKFSFVYALSHAKSILYTRDVWIAFFLTFLKRPLFYEIHDLPEHPSWIHRRAWAKSSGIIVISNGLREDLIRSGISEEKILIARDAVQLEKFQIKESKEECRRRLNLPLDKKIILYTGHLYKWKGVGILIQAVKNIDTNFFLYIVGGTEEDISKLKSEHSKLKNIIFVGHQTHTKIPCWLRAADVVVIPTSGKEKIGSRYTSPIKLFEYMASGTPIIASDIPSTKEVVLEKEVSYFKSDDPEDLVRTIEHLFNNYDEVCRETEQLALHRVKEHTWNKRAEDIIKFIEKHENE